MTMSPYGHLIAGIAALAATLAISSLTVNRLVRRKLRLSLLLLGTYVALHLVLAVLPSLKEALDKDLVSELLSVGRLAFAAGVINLLVIAFLNPLRIDRVHDRYPAILQDFIVVGLLLLVATFVFAVVLVPVLAGALVVLAAVAVVLLAGVVLAAILLDRR